PEWRNTMRCRKARSYLSAFCHDELAGRRRLAVSEHLLKCNSCREEEVFYREMSAASVELAPPPLSDDFNAKLLHRIAHERFAETRSKAYLPKSAPVIAWGRLAPVLITACLAVFAFISLVPGDDGGSPSLATRSSGLDDSYLTAQPDSNPNLTVRLNSDWSLDRQLAHAQRADRISNAIIPASSFGGRQHQGPLHARLAASGQPIPYVIQHYQMRPVLKTYVAPRSNPGQEGSKPY
ncbi:MAG: zf-HC2 domain-containing protein, partial [bacterium]